MLQCEEVPVMLQCEEVPDQGRLGGLVEACALLTLITPVCVLAVGQCSGQAYLSLQPVE